MDSIQDYPSSQEYLVLNTQISYPVSSYIISKEYVRVYINNVVLPQDNFDIYTNKVVLNIQATVGSILKIKVASNSKGILKLNEESSQEAVLDALNKMNTVISNIETTKSVFNLLAVINRLYVNRVNISVVASKLINIKNIADNISMFSNIDIKNHSTISYRGTQDSHNIESITGLQDAINSIQLAGIFPTSIVKSVPLDSVCLVRENGTVKTMPVTSLMNNDFRLETPVNPYFINNGVLQNTEGVYGNNSIKGILNVNKNIKGALNPLVNVKSDMIIPICAWYNSSLYGNNSNMPNLSFLCETPDSRGYMVFYINIYDNLYYSFNIKYLDDMSDKSYYKLKVVNNTIYTVRQIVTAHLYLGHNLALSSKTVIYKVVLLDSTPMLLKTSLLFDNGIPYVQLDIITDMITTATGGSLPYLNYSEGTFYINNEPAFQRYDVSSKIRHTMRSSVTYNGEVYSSTYVYNINSMDSKNGAYRCYFSMNTKKYIFIHWTKVLTTSASAVITTGDIYYIEDKLYNAVINFNSTATNIYLFDYDLVNKRFIAAYANTVLIYYDANTNFVGTYVLTTSWFYNTWLLPRDIYGNVYIGMSSNRGNSIAILKNFTFLYSMDINNYRTEVYPRGQSTYGGTFKPYNLNERYVKKEDLHLMATNPLVSYM